MRLRRADVPLERDASSRFLPWLVAFMVFLATLALASALAMHEVVARWDQGLSGRMTVQIPPPTGAGAEGALAERVARARAVLIDTPGVEQAVALEQAEVVELLRPWLGEGALVEELPLPALIAVTLDRAAPPDLAALAERLEAVAPGSLLDDHQRWIGGLLALARTLELVALLVVLAVILAAVLTVVFVTRTGLSIHRQVIELLHLIGAHDGYIARQFQTHALRLGIRGSLIGFLFAALTILLIGHLLARVQTGLLPNLALSLPQWLVIMLVPLLAAAVTTATARVTVLRTLSRLP